MGLPEEVKRQTKFEMPDPEANKNFWAYRVESRWFGKFRRIFKGVEEITDEYSQWSAVIYPNLLPTPTLAERRVARLKTERVWKEYEYRILPVFLGYDLRERKKEQKELRRQWTLGKKKCANCGRMRHEHYHERYGDNLECPYLGQTMPDGSFVPVHFMEKTK